MKLARRSLGLMLLGAGGLLLVGPAIGRLFASTSLGTSASTSLGTSASTSLGTSTSTPLSPGQDQATNRRELTIVARDFHFTPNRIEVTKDDLVKLTVRSEDIAHGFAIDEYRIVKRISSGGATTFEFRADRAGTFPFYCNLTGEPGHQMERGELIVRGK